MLLDLIRIVHQVVLNSHVPAKALAKEIGKPYSTLLREVNPYDSGAKLGVETLMDIMRETGNVEPLAYMAKQFGYTLVADVSNSVSKARPELLAEERNALSA